MAQAKLALKWALFIVIAFAALKIAPAYVTAMRFKFAVYEAARDGATMRSTADAIRGRILWHAKSLGVALNSEDVIVEVDSHSRLVTARTSHAIPVGLLLTTLNLTFHNSFSELPSVSAGDFKPDSQPASTDEAPQPERPPAVAPDWYKTGKG